MLPRRHSGRQGDVPNERLCERLMDLVAPVQCGAVLILEIPQQIDLLIPIGASLGRLQFAEGPGKTHLQPIGGLILRVFSASFCRKASARHASCAASSRLISVSVSYRFNRCRPIASSSSALLPRAQCRGSPGLCFWLPLYDTCETSNSASRK